MSKIKAGTTSTTAYQVEADTTGTLVLQTGATPTTALTLNADQSVTFAQAANLPNTFGFKNRIINGAMIIDQRNAGASVTPTNGQYSVDRFSCALTQASKYTVQQNAGAVTPPTGFINYLGATSSSAYSVVSGDFFAIQQRIEGLNVTDLGWGAAGAASVTLSFWVRSSITGTHSGAVSNASVTRSYPFTFTVNTSNTWEQKSVTIAGETSGTWLTTNGIGIILSFSLGMGSTYAGTANTWGAANYGGATGAVSVVGTSGATFYITGVQLEKGSTATSFDYRPYGTELALCQRYLPAATGNYCLQGQCVSTTQAYLIYKFSVTARTAPTGISTAGGTGQTITNSSMGNAALSSIAFSSGETNSGMVFCTVASGLTAGNATTYNTNGGQLLFTGCEL